MTYIEKICDKTGPQNHNAEKWRADQLEKMIEVARFASTWEKDISKFHLQLSRRLIHEIPDLERDLTMEKLDEQRQGAQIENIQGGAQSHQRSARVVEGANTSSLHGEMQRTLTL